MYNLTANPELKNEIFKRIQTPKIKLFWQDGKPTEKDISRFVTSASGSIEFENIERQATKNTFDVTLENTDNDPDMPGFWFPQNSFSNGENVRVELGYEHSGAGRETIVMSKGLVRQLSGNTETKVSSMSVLDNGKDFDKEIDSTTFYKNIKPYQLIEQICALAGYLTSNAVGNKKLIIRTKVNGDTDESFMITKYFCISGQTAWTYINELCECSLGRFFINRSGDAEYWTYNYWSDKFSSTKTDVEFTASTIKDTDDEILPMFTHQVECSYGNMINSTEISFYEFIKKENYDENQILFQLSAGETEVLEYQISNGFVEYLNTNYNVTWLKEAYLDENMQGTTQGTYIEILGVENRYNKLLITVKNNSANYLYCYINPKVVTGYVYKGKSVTKKESDDLFPGGTLNYERNKENKKSVSFLYIQNNIWADEIAKKYIELYRNPTRTTSFRTIGVPNLDLGDTIRTKNHIEVKNKNVYGWVNKIDWNYDLDNGFIFEIMMYIMSSNNAFSVILLDEFINLDFTSSYNGLDFTGSSFQLSNSPGGFSSDTNGNIIIDRFGGLLNQGIGDEKTSSQTNVSTGFNLSDGGFKTLGFTPSFAAGNGNIIIDRFGGLLNQGIADEKTSSQTNIATGFNLQGGFRTLGFNASFTIVV